LCVLVCFSVISVILEGVPKVFASGLVGGCFANTDGLARPWASVRV